MLNCGHTYTLKGAGQRSISQRVLENEDLASISSLQTPIPDPERRIGSNTSYKNELGTAALLVRRETRERAHLKSQPLETILHRTVAAD